MGSTPDLALCEFLMTVDSNSEAAEYLTLYLGKTEAVREFGGEAWGSRLCPAKQGGGAVSPVLGGHRAGALPITE